MDVNKNSYTFGFAVVMVVIVASLLAIAAISLKPFQEKNVVAEKRQNILTTIGIEVSREEAANAYQQNISDSYVLNYKGEVVEGEAFDVDLGVEVKKSKEEQQLPIFVSEKEGKKTYILPMRGKGLWGPIWGYLALKEDMSTISGAVFDHKSETPGLGAEISLGWFQEPFIGKTIYDGETLVSVKVVKGGAKEGDMHGVDGISGGTITADGVSKMLSERLNMYSPFLESKRNEIMSLETDSLMVDTVYGFSSNIIVQ
jgi:Na+-transporting NADH:ubiquinone oxidoreductase subunit C